MEMPSPDNAHWEDAPLSPAWTRLVDPLAAWLMSASAPVIIPCAFPVVVCGLLATGVIHLDFLQRFIGLGAGFVALGMPFLISLYVFNKLNRWAHRYCRSPLFRSNIRIPDLQEVDRILKDHPDMVDQVARWAVLNGDYLHMRHLWRLRALYGKLDWHGFSCNVSPVKHLPVYDPTLSLASVLGGAVSVSMQAQVLARETPLAAALPHRRRL